MVFWFLFSKKIIIYQINLALKYLNIILSNFRGNKCLCIIFWCIVFIVCLCEVLKVFKISLKILNRV
jgi:hypothetical protein